jgi:D-glycero-D-manno-heptose 1,7-bisphosphate phosphatase
LGLAVVTTQSAIGRGFYDWKRLEKIHRRLEDLLSQGRVIVDHIFVCPHIPEDGWRCRKPDPGLVWQAAQKFGFDPTQAFVIGDKACDIGLGERIGTTTLLVRTGYGNEELARGNVCPDFVVSDLGEAAQVIEAIFMTDLGRLGAEGIV